MADFYFIYPVFVGVVAVATLGTSSLLLVRMHRAEKPHVGQVWWWSTRPDHRVRVRIDRDRGMSKTKQHVIDGTCRMEFRRQHQGWDATIIETGEGVHIESIEQLTGRK